MREHENKERNCEGVGERGMRPRWNSIDAISIGARKAACKKHTRAASRADESSAALINRRAMKEAERNGDTTGNCVMDFFSDLRHDARESPDGSITVAESRQTSRQTSLQIELFRCFQIFEIYFSNCICVNIAQIILK